MAHRYNAKDVERSLQRYRELTGDTDAELTLQPTTNPNRPDGPEVTIFRVIKSQGLRSFEVWGAASAYFALECYSNGWEDHARSQK